MQKKSIIFNKKGIPDTHFFVYKTQNYPFKFDFFKHSSKYFSENKKQLKKSKYIPLVDEEKNTGSDFRPEWIIDFINFVQCQEITLHNMNVLCLNYLSNIYEIDTLYTITSNYISTNQDELALQIILHQNDSKFNTIKYEDIISCKFEQYIENDDILNINLPILQRIVKKFVKQNNLLEKEINDKILLFLMKCLDKYGSIASVLFNDFEIVKSSPSILDKFISAYSNVFDFNFLNKNDFINLYKEKKKQESEQENNKKENQERISKLESNKKQLEQDKEKLESVNRNLQNNINKYEEEKKEQEKREISLKNEIIKLTKEIEKIKSKMNEIEQKKGMLFVPNNSNFNGIINYLRNLSNLIVFTASSYDSQYNDRYPINVTKFEDYKNVFLSNDEPGSWICLDFKEHRIIPTHYTLKSTNGFWFEQHPKNWIFEGSADQTTWTTLDEQRNCQQLHGCDLTYTFKVQNQSTTEFRYVRIRSTGPNWSNSNYLLIDSIEIYGKLI